MKEGFDPQETEADFRPTVLHEGGGVVALVKPAGLPTQAPPGVASAEAWLRGRLDSGAYVGVPHRLDRAVSGVLLLAVTPRAARKLARQFERREIEKAYLALVADEATGSIRPGPAEWRDFVVKIADEPQARIAAADEPGAREAVTLVRSLARPLPGALLVRLEPLTGRMHQLRVQAASRGMPIIGDTHYGARASTLAAFAPAADPRHQAIALHAHRIRYADPITGTAITLEAPLPAAWPAAVRAASGS
jgi:23S rRNA pseudouridine1911/1915/1917 synthase